MLSLFTLNLYLLAGIMKHIFVFKPKISQFNPTEQYQVRYTSKGHEDCTSHNWIMSLLQWLYFEVQHVIPALLILHKRLTHFMSMFYFYAPWKRLKTSCFLMFSGCRETEHWANMDWSVSLKKQQNWRETIELRKNA